MANTSKEVKQRYQEAAYIEVGETYELAGTGFEKLDEELKNKTEWIIPNAQKNIMEPIRLTLEPGGQTYPDTPHEGEEFGYVLKGEITIVIGKKIYKAKAGEAFYYTPDKKHYITSKKGAKILWVSAPPSF